MDKKPDDLPPEPTEFHAINPYPETPEGPEAEARHLRWLTIKYAMNRALAGRRPEVIPFDPEAFETADDATPFIVEAGLGSS